MHKAVLLKIALREPAGVAEEAKDQFFLAGVKDGLRCAWPHDDVELLRFFAGTHNEQAFAVIRVSDTATHSEAFQCAQDHLKPYIEPKSLDNDDARYVAWAKMEGNSSVEGVSRFLRSNTTLDIARYRTCNGKHCLADADGFAVLSAKETSLEHFRRVVRTYALAVAYSEALISVSQDASRVATGDAVLAERTMRTLTTFMVAHYFDHPISTRTRELLEFYAVARDQLRLVEQSRETTAQLNLLSQVVREERRDAALAARERARELRRQQERDRKEQLRLARQRQASLEAQIESQRKDADSQQAKLQNRLSILSVVVAAIGLVQITPTSVTSFAKDWHAFVSPNAEQDHAPPAEMRQLDLIKKSATEVHGSGGENTSLRLVKPHSTSRLSARKASSPRDDQAHPR
ncbi:hypothetical protein HBF26_12075 [Luteibacter jiangsuensis]|uniref:Uncharacterized protein n=1 Tax=Luteibacter jiangsuensis TaxID=637577 RepID=A0ABX0Q5K4_9GAMM|nr:hypothetical protein [Luteibacter jiangsuensis]NID05628.1 hypothetical protein [Luteibacter jiangsuensis]